ncbi:hypothetical protein [Streptomyces pseudovenezuelae]|uniref:hypothetical protein n=1 Tax=Streptomyces pseudovenezuelae TaxID=67350 RepID=UPI003717A3D6
MSDQVWTHSRFICVAGLRSVAAAAPRHPPAETCTSLADTLLDAALLLPGLRDALPAADPRTRATLALATYRRERPWFARRQLGGNLPQVFVPALLLEAAARLGD